MKNHIKTFAAGILLFLSFFTDNNVKAQQIDKIPSSKDIQVSIQHIRQIDSSSLEFDIYLLNTNSELELELASFQAGINFNTGILNGSGQNPLMAEIISGTSELKDSLAPIRVNTSTQGLIKLAGRPLPGKGKGNIIPSEKPGILICRLRFTNPVPFADNSSPEFSFTSSKPGLNSYATRVSVYQNRSGVQLDVVPLENAIVTQHIVLNPKSDE